MPFATIKSKSLFYSDDAQSPSSSSQLTTVFIHGLGSSSCFFKTIIPKLLSLTRCIALDTPGSGLSELGKSEQSIGSIASDVIGLLDHLNIEGSVVIVGHSMGGIVASEIAARWPVRVKGIVLIGPVDPGPPLRVVFQGRIEAVGKDGLEGLASTIPTAATGKKASSLQHAFIRALILGTSQEGYISLCRAIATATRPDYSAITAPMVILAGEDDKTAPVAGCEAILRSYGTSEARKGMKKLIEVGHWHCVEDPEAVQSVVGEFLEGLE